MLSPADLAGKKKLNLGGSADSYNDQFALLAKILENDGRGVLTTAELKSALEEVQTKGSAVTSKELNLFFDFYSTQGFLSFADPTIKKAIGKDGKPKDVSDFQEMVGKDLKLPDKFDVMYMLSRSPFFHPSKRHTKRIETFLNAMPSIVIAQMSPYLEVEFQVAKDSSDYLQTTSQLKFLLGAEKKESLEGANKAMLEGQSNKKDDKEYDFFGMEMFTSPQTLVNPTPNVSPGSSDTFIGRYTDVLDPFRPFASLESATVTVTPAVGMYTYKKAHLVIKLHDRSRLAEISDLIRPKSYSNVTVWLTYGWRAPRTNTDPGMLTYTDFINNNMLMREAYGVINSSFSFDQVGQVTINLELYTKGVSEMRTMKITDTFGDAAKTVEDIKKLAEDISLYRKKLKLDPPEGINKEIRAYQVLDAAQVGEFPDMKPSDVHAAVASLRSAFSKKGQPDPDEVKKLFDSLDKLYASDQSKTKFSLKDRIENQATATVKKKFDEMLTGPDPFLPSEEKNAGAQNGKDLATDLANEIKKYNQAPLTTVKAFKPKAVSFGKLFSVFATDCVAHAGIVDELQVFFYALNSQCGPVSSHSIAEFPIDMSTFLDQYRDHIVKRGGERITLEEFLGLVINAQVLDNRAIGYGLRSVYQPYDPKNKDAQVKKDGEKELENALAAQSKKYGAFKKPVIEMYIETSHQRPKEAGDSDILHALAYSAKDATLVVDDELKAGKLQRIMRIHIYDKQVSPSVAATQLLRSTGGGGFLQVPSTEYAKQFVKSDMTELQQFFAAMNIEADTDPKTGNVRMASFTTARQVKDAVSRLMPTITYGANGTTVISANLTSKADPLLSTVNMLRSNTVKNTAAPNGSGEGGIPLRVIPAALTMTTLGCPLATMAQQYFIDFNTGTSVDNLYIVTGLTHTFAAGKYETQWTLGYSDAYGVFEGAPNILDYLKSISSDIPKKPK
jgi:hypothetical protein